MRLFFFFSSRRRHTRCSRDWSSDVCSSDLPFFTGRQKLIDTEGRVERFTKKFGVQTSEQRKTAARAVKDAKAKTTGATKRDRKSVVVGKECRSRWSP